MVGDECRCSGWRTSTTRRPSSTRRSCAAFNGEYIRALPRRAFIAALRAVARARALGPRGCSTKRRRPLVQTRVAVLSEVTAERRLPVPRRAGLRPGVLGQGDEELRRRRSSPGTLARARDGQLGPRVAQDRAGGGRRSRTALKLGKAQAPVRVAVTGRTVGLPLFESIEVLGRERSMDRIRAALAKLA